MDDKELQKTVNPIYLTAKGTLSLLYQVKDPDAVALMPLVGLETNLQERAKTIHRFLSEYDGTWMKADGCIFS